MRRLLSRVLLVLGLVNIAVMAPLAQAAPKIWYGGGNLPNGTGEPINDATGQWQPMGSSPRIGATDSGHISGILIKGLVAGAITNLNTKAVSNTWTTSDTWTFRWTDCSTDATCASPSYSATTIQYVNGATGADSDTTNSFTVTSGNYHEWQWFPSPISGSGDMRIPFYVGTFTPTSGDSWQWATGEAVDYTAASTSRYIPVAGDNAATTEINSTRLKVRVAGAITAYGRRVFSNARTTTSTFQLLQNGATIGSGIAFTAGTTGWQDDAGYGSPVSIAVDDYLVERVTTSTGSEIMRYTSSSIAINPTTSGEWQPAVTTNGTTFTQGQTRWIPFMGSGVDVATTEDNAEMLAPSTIIVDRCVGYIRANSLGGGQSLDVSLMVDGSAVRTMVWESGSGAAERAFTDTSAVTITAGQTVSWQALADAGTGTAQLMSVTCRAVDASASGSKNLLLLGVGLCVAGVLMAPKAQAA